MQIEIISRSIKDKNNYKKDIVGFKGKRGTILIYNSWGVHRAKPTSNKEFVRKTLFFQVEKDTKQCSLSSAETILDIL